MDDKPFISNKITYNNFPFIEIPKEEAAKVTDKAKKILEVRGLYTSSSLADLYDEASMPSNLLLAHRDLDAVVLSTYKLKPNSSEGDILSTLFRLYAELSDDKLL